MFGTTEFSKKKQPKGFSESRIVAREGGHVAGTARKEIEKKTGERVVSKKNGKDLLAGIKEKNRLSSRMSKKGTRPE